MLRCVSESHPEMRSGDASSSSSPGSAEKLSAIPDCGFFPVPRWVAAEKLKRLVAGAKIVRDELSGKK